MPTLAELRARSGPLPLPKRTVTVTLIEGQHLLDESQRLIEELDDILVAHQRTNEDGEKVGPPRKAGERAYPPEVQARIDEIKVRNSDLLAELADHQAELGLVGITGGEWQTWKDVHPPREDNAADLRLASGLCNSSDLFNDLGRYAKSWNGEALADTDWSSWLAESITYADRRDMVATVIAMHEAGMSRAPKSPTVSSGTAPSATD